MTKDSLERYRQKRDFSKTPEPEGTKAKPSGRGYLIQKHAASHLHYDFRLELDGTLKSWAVPRGPSYDPADKRLAMQVEDHPAAYGTFEGTIPKGQYGGGTVMLWDEGSWEPLGDPRAGLAKGKLVFQLYGKRLKGEWTLVKTFSRDKKDNKWLLIKHKDDKVRLGDNEEFLAKNAKSIVSGRTMEEIAAAGDKVWRSDRSAVEVEKPKKKGAAAKTDPGADVAIDRDNERAAKAAAGLSAARGQPSKMPGFSPPQLATLSSGMPKGDEWVHEIKFDGYRMIAHIEKGAVRMFSRNGKDWTNKFGPIESYLSEYDVQSAILDGEVVVADEQGRSNFSALKDALGSGVTERMQFYVFDILFFNGKSLTRLPLLERKEILRSLIEKNKTKANSKHLLYSEHFKNQTDRFLQSVCSLHFEGIMSKRIDAPYMPGRTKVWLKTKCHMRQEFVIGGFTLPSTGGLGIGSLLLGCYDTDRLVYAGRVGTGFTSEASQKLRKTLDKLKQKEMPFASISTEAKRRALWVEPKLVGEVEFTEWTPDGRLRHPSFQGLREDKAAISIVKEVAVSPRAIATDVEEEVEHAQKRSGAKGSAKAAKISKTEPKTASKNSKAPKKPQAHAAALPALSARRGDTNAAEIGGIKISHPARIIYPDSGLTKQQLAEYYLSVADQMMPYIRERPISMLRCPEGIGKECFFQRHVGLGKSPFIEEVAVSVKGESRKYVKIKDQKGLLSLVQWGVVEIHPWECSVKNLDSPDRIIFDLDPDPSVSWGQVVAGAGEVRERLNQIGLQSFLKTTGGKGLHIVAPLAPIYDWKTIKAFAHAVAVSMTVDSPQKYIATMSKAARKDKIFIDYLRNDVTSTAVAPFSARARPGAYVSMPLRWDELTPSLKPSAFTIETAPHRLEKQKTDPWQNFLQMRQKIPAAFLKALKT
ncbi:MAG: DNA ligase D [Pseudomonadota bacterium]|nr:DNA ligase D [Pseudomonadota bacterium]